MKQISALALSLVVLAGCDFVGAESALVPIASLSVEGLPNSDRGGVPWDDDGTAPDIFIEIQNAAGRSFYQSEVIQDADVDAPLAFSLADAVEVPFSAMPMFVVVYESDGNPSEAAFMMTAEGFEAADLLAQPTLVLRDIRGNRQSFAVEVTSAATAGG